MIEQTYKLNMIPRAEQDFRSSPVVHISQYDKGLRTLVFNLYNGSDRMTIPAGQTAKIYGKKPDANVFEYDMTITEDRQSVSIVLQEQMAVIAGRVECEVRVLDGQATAGSANFILAVEKAPVGADEVYSESEIPEIDNLLYGGTTGQVFTKTSTGARWADIGTDSGLMMKSEYDPNDTGSVLKADHADDASTVEGHTVARDVLANEYTNGQIDSMMQAAGTVKTVNSVQPDQNGNVQIAKADIGLGNVDNTSDANKPISTATQAALDQKVDKVSGKGLSTNDYTDADKTKLGDLPTGAEITAALAGKVDKESGKGLSTNDFTDAEKTKLQGIETGAQVNTVTGVKGSAESTYRTGDIDITKANIGLGNVDNTSDLNKPISTAVQNALDLKANAAEVENARIGADGTVYNTLGNAIRGQVSDLNDAVSALNEIVNSIEIEGFDKSEYKDLIASGEAELHDNAYVEYSGNSVVITSNSSYHYYSVAVSKGETYKATGLARWHIRPIIFANANGDLIGMVPTNAPSAEPYTVTVEATVPAGATVMYTTAQKGNPIEVFRKQPVYTSDYDSRISELENDIEIYDGIEIEGFEKETWVDSLSEATYHENAYVEKYGENIKVSSNRRYYYYECDVTEGKRYKSKALNFFDIRHIYANDDGTVLAMYPTERVTSPVQATVESVAPTGSTKLYLSNFVENDSEFYTEGIYYKSTEENDAQINVLINKSATEDTVVSSLINGKTVKNGFQVFNTARQPNSAVLPASCSYDNKYLMHNEDDNCPVNLASGYLGAGHGYDRARKITAANHGKTYADIGSEWISGKDHAWLVRVVDADTLIFIGRNSSSTAYDTNSFTGNTFTHVSGAVHTDTITGTANAVYLIAPVDKNHIKKIMLDGITEVSENGEYKAKSFVDIIDEYDVINPQSIVSEVVANKPQGGYTENPAINTGSTFLHFSNVYRILSDGTVLIFTTLDNDLNVNLTYWGATQYAQKSPANAFGGALFRYIPKVLPIDGRDFRLPFNMANWDFTANAVKSVWENANFPPDRLLHLFTDANNNYVAGYAVGYLPVAYGEASARKNNVGNAVTLYYTKKAYFHLIDSEGESGGAWQSYTPFQSIVYRKPVIDVADIHTDAYFVPLDEKCYLYADYHAVSDDRIKVPAEYIGKPITVIEKSDNVTVYGTIATDEIRIRVASSDPMYGYAVIQIG